jgi:hypothetical protein
MPLLFQRRFGSSTAHPRRHPPRMIGGAFDEAQVTDAAGQSNDELVI